MRVLSTILFPWYAATRHEKSMVVADESRLREPMLWTDTTSNPIMQLTESSLPAFSSITSPLRP